MKDGLMLLERIIIESVSKKEKNIYELCVDTNLDQTLLLNILPELLMKNLIRYNRGIYSLNRELCLTWKDTINNKENLKDEVKEIFTSLVNGYFQDDINNKASAPILKVQKVWLTKDEEITLNSHLAGIDIFFKSIKQKRDKAPMKEKTSEQKILILGLTNYSDVLSGILEAV